jgi:SAM-dependent methyltransferase
MHPDWFEDEAFWTATFPFMFPEERFERAASDISKIIALTGCPNAASILDLCCGPGRHSVPLAKQGFTVTGVDRSAFLLGKAKAYGEREQVNVTWIKEDMRRFVQPGTFNLAMSMFSSFGYFDDMKENESVLRNLYSSLVGSGVLILDLVGKEALAKMFQPTGSQALPNGDLLFERRSLRGDWEGVESEWTVVSGSEANKYCLRLWIFSARELKDLLRRVGFEKVTIYGNLDGSGYGLDSNRLIAVARK